MSRKNILLFTAISLALMGGSITFPKTDFLIWNRTKSAPQGLYWRSNGPLTLNGWAIVSGRSKGALWASNAGFVGEDWPLIKRVRAMPGDRICREKEAVFINGKQIATALPISQNGTALPSWQGCHIVADTEVFLLNDHPRSLDGRYFGVTSLEDISGSARLIWQW